MSDYFKIYIFYYLQAYSYSDYILFVTVIAYVFNALAKPIHFMNTYAATIHW